jgi:hypothetical protein
LACQRPHRFAHLRGRVKDVGENAGGQFRECEPIQKATVASRTPRAATRPRLRPLGRGGSRQGEARSPQDRASLPGRQLTPAAARVIAATATSQTGRRLPSGGDSTPAGGVPIGVDSLRPGATVVAVASEARAGTGQISRHRRRPFSLSPWKVAPRALHGPTLCSRSRALTRAMVPSLRRRTCRALPHDPLPHDPPKVKPYASSGACSDV